MEKVTLPEDLEFDWNSSNSTKSWIKHKVTSEEQEEAFFSYERMVVEDTKHSQVEKRLLLLSKTDKGRKLIIAFTIRTLDKKQKIRPISARPMNRKEAQLYEETLKVA